MGMLKVDGVTHWSIPVNDLEEAERFYGDVLGFQYQGRLGTDMADLLVVFVGAAIVRRSAPARKSLVHFRHDTPW